MYLTAPDTPPKLVTCYDFAFSTGLVLTQIVDTAFGDTFHEGPTYIHIKITEKPHPTIPNLLIPAEDHKFYYTHLLSVRKTLQEASTLSPEEKLAWEETIKTLTGETPIH